jgi:hypothetical protein
MSDILGLLAFVSLSFLLLPILFVVEWWDALSLSVRTLSAEEESERY